MVGRAIRGATVALVGCLLVPAAASAAPRIVYRAPSIAALAGSDRRAVIAVPDPATPCMKLVALRLRSPGGHGLGCVDDGIGSPDEIEITFLVQDRRRTTFASSQRGNSSTEATMESVGPAPLVEFSADAFAQDGVGTWITRAAASGALTAVLVERTEFDPPDCDFPEELCPTVDAPGELLLATATRTAAVGTPAKVSAVTVGDGAAFVATPDLGSILRTTMAGAFTTVTLDPARPPGATILVGGGHIVTVAGWRVGVYADRGGERLRAWHLHGASGLVALAGTILVSRDAAGIRVLDLTTGREARVVRRRGALAGIQQLATTHAGILYTSIQRRGRGTTVVLVRWADVRRALDHAGSDG